MEVAVEAIDMKRIIMLTPFSITSMKNGGFDILLDVGY